jgi:hypothetical protein
MGGFNLMLRLQKTISSMLLASSFTGGTFVLAITTNVDTKLTRPLHYSARFQWRGTASQILCMSGGAQDDQTRENQDPAGQSGTGTTTAEAPDSRTGAGAEDQIEIVTLPAGTVISVRLADTVNSNKSHTGEQFSGTVDPSVMVGDRVVIPRGTEAHIHMAEDKKGGRVHGHAEVQLELTSMIINGRKIEAESNAYDKKKGVLASKVKGEAKAGADAGGDTAASGVPSHVADPVIAAFRAAKVVKPAGSKIDFTLTAPFTFEKPPITTNP